MTRPNVPSLDAARKLRHGGEATAGIRQSAVAAITLAARHHRWDLIQRLASAVAAWERQELGTVATLVDDLRGITAELQRMGTVRPLTERIADGGQP